jgi:hypothetical protein
MGSWEPKRRERERESERELANNRITSGMENER